MVKVLIVDDEIRARENLSMILTAYKKSQFEIDFAENVDKAKITIKNNPPDLLFLDIEMPNKNGFQLIKEMGAIDFPVIFVTAYDHYAIKAFEVSAFDYLLKPIDIDRLYLCVERVLNYNNKNNIYNRLKALQENESEGKLTKIAIPEKGDYVLLDTNDIVCIEANRTYVHIHAKDNSYIYSKPLKYFEYVLMENNQFIRVHRSWIVNANFIKMYSKKDSLLQMKNDLEISVSRSYKENLQAYIKN